MEFTWKKNIGKISLHSLTACIGKSSSRVSYVDNMPNFARHSMHDISKARRGSYSFEKSLDLSLNYVTWASLSYERKSVTRVLPGDPIQLTDPTMTWVLQLVRCLVP